MTEVVTNNDHVGALHDIINNAKKFVIFACPFWYVPGHLEDTAFSIFDDDIKAALERDVEILFICNPEFLELLREYYRPLYIQYNRKIKVYSLEDDYSWYDTYMTAHGKIYANEYECLVTSQNITGLNRSLDIGIRTDEPYVHMEVMVWIGELLWRGETYRALQFDDMMEGTPLGNFIEWQRQQNNKPQ